MLALLYDIHGNLAALDAVLGDAGAQGARRHLLGGDYALFGPRPAETVARLRDLDDAHWIRGNGERWTAGADDVPDNEVVPGAIEVCRAELGEELVAELAALPFSHAEEGVLYVHGSPLSDVRSFLPAAGDDEAELLAGARAARIVFGHTHLPFARAAAVDAEIELVNPGSVGMPFDGDPRAAYALVHPDGRIEHRRVAYDHERAAADVRARFDGGWADVVARRIEIAQL